MIDKEVSTAHLAHIAPHYCLLPPPSSRAFWYGPLYSYGSILCVDHIYQTSMKRKNFGNDNYTPLTTLPC